MNTTVAERSWCVIVPHHARGARMARHRLIAALTDEVPADLVADVAAVAAELIGNAVRHAAPLPGGVIRVDWRVFGAGTVEVRVTDGGSAEPPQVREATPEAVDGRGLTIVAALASRWGFDRDVHGQSVWAELG
ncbi:MAG TPA: ATP-binding protein [Micromonosporaceae bacterium]|nr:ATP-binding protein [Micromonosporaceae bacterium]